MKKSFLKIYALIAIAFAVFSCDKDFNSVGSDIIDDANFELVLDEETPILAYTKETGAVQTNNLPINALGFYSNPIFGKTEANFVTQLEMETLNPNFGTDIDIKSNDSVYLYIPYFSTKTTTNDITTYELDSIYGNKLSNINLEIFENRYYLRDLSPNTDPNDVASYNQKYYSNDQSLVESNSSGFKLNNSSNPEENTAFVLKNEEIVIYKTDGNGNYLDADNLVTTDPDKRVVKEKLAPGIWINLDKDFIKNKFLLAPRANLTNNNTFKEYFKGLYFKVSENVGQEGFMALLDFSKGYIKINYHSTLASVEKKRDYKLKLSGNRINFFNNDFTNSEYINAVNSGDIGNMTTGDSKLFLKGGNGTISYIELFGSDLDNNGEADRLQEIKNSDYIVNEAYLEFHVDNSLMTSNANHPNRIYIFNASDNSLLFDYVLDGSQSNYFKNNKFVFDGIVKEVNGEKSYYKIRITEQLKRWINSEDKLLSKNMRLGLVVTENINFSSMGFLRTPINLNGDIQKFVPLASVINPLGTVLYGNTTSVPNDKKLKLKIYFTKPN